jgi:hypothetical protein
MSSSHAAFALCLLATPWTIPFAPLTALAIGSGAPQRPMAVPSDPPRAELIEIDGSRNPELIPQWAAWEFAFRVIGGGQKELPAIVFRVVSTEERALILAAAQASLQRDRACHARLEKLAPLVGKEQNSVINAKQREIQLDCRWETIHARDALLERLRPQARTALITFVEDTKQGTKSTVSKRGLAHYLQPQ